jgi:ankyrin repeat protein
MTKKITDLPIELRVKIYDQCTTMSLLNFGEAKPSFIPEIVKYSKDKNKLWFAATAGFPIWIKTMARLGFNIDTKDKDQWTALHYATCKCDPNVMSTLINVGANLNIKDRHWTALHWATFNKDPKCLKLLIKAGANVNIKDSLGLTALNHAIFGNHESFKILIDSGADVNTQDNRGLTILHHLATIHKDDNNEIDLLIKAGADVNRRDQNEETPLFWYVRNTNNDLNMLKLLKAGANVNARDRFGWLALAWAIDCGKPHVMQILIDRGANVNDVVNESTGTTMLHFSVLRLNCVDCAKVLLKNGANPSAKDSSGMTALDLVHINHPHESAMSELFSHYVR